MEATLDAEGRVDYQLPLDDQRIPMNTLIGKPISIEHLGDIHCIHCGRRSKKSFSQGYCYPCFTKLPQCDTCIMSPENVIFIMAPVAIQNGARSFVSPTTSCICLIPLALKWVLPEAHSCRRAG